MQFGVTVGPLVAPRCSPVVTLCGLRDCLSSRVEHTGGSVRDGAEHMIKAGP